MVRHFGTSNRTSRRGFLSGIGASALLAGIAPPVGAKRGNGKDDESEPDFRDSPADFRLFWSGVTQDGSDEPTLDPNEEAAFGYPGNPPNGYPDASNLSPGLVDNWTPTGGLFLPLGVVVDANGDPEDGYQPVLLPVSHDPGGGAGLFDGTLLDLTPNEQTVHHSLQFFGGTLIDGRPKPFTLVNQGDGLFEARGATINFTARSADEMRQLLVSAGFPDDLAYLVTVRPPLSVLADGEEWRGVVTERFKVDLSGQRPYEAEWDVVRIDFYRRGGGEPAPVLSLLYVLWNSPTPIPDPTIPSVPDAVAREFIEQGRLNLGGQ